jgi:hypothetical protein
MDIEKWQAFDVIRIRRGVCGEGFKFFFTERDSAGNVYGKTWAGSNYGPVRSSEVEFVDRPSKLMTD